MVQIARDRVWFGWARDGGPRPLGFARVAKNRMSAMSDAPRGDMARPPHIALQVEVRSDTSTVEAVQGDSMRQVAAFGRRGGSAPIPILFVHHAGLNWIRGSTRCLLDLLTHIDRTRFRPIVWCNQPVILDAVAALDVEVREAPYWHGCHPLRPDAAWVRAARALIDEFGIRLVHLDDFTQAVVLVPAARRARIPVLAQLHQVPTADERRWSWLHQVDLVVGTTRACVTGLLEDGFPASRALVIYNGVDPVRLSQGDATGLRAELGIPPGSPTLTIVASLIHRKAIDVALDAFSLLRGRDDRPHLLLCGDGPERRALEHQAQALQIDGYVHFLGERSDAGAVLRDATDILLAPSRDESFGLTLAEAGLFGIPVAASAIDAHREVLGDGEAGILVPTEDAASLADALATLCSRPDLRARMGSACRERVERLFLIDRYVHDFEDLFTQLVSKSPATYGWLRATRWPHTYSHWLRESLEHRVATALRRTGAPTPHRTPRGAQSK
jgi:L-malate glycosyltransferase